MEKVKGSEFFPKALYITGLGTSMNRDTNCSLIMFNSWIWIVFQLDIPHRKQNLNERKWNLFKINVIKFKWLIVTAVLLFIWRGEARWIWGPIRSVVSVHGESLIKKDWTLCKRVTKTINQIRPWSYKMRPVLTQATNIDNHPQTNSATQAT